MYAGAAERFSTDLDFSVACLDDDPATVTQLLIGAIDGTTLGPFTYGVEDRRGRYAIVYRSQLGPDPAGPLHSQIDVGPPPWLAPTERMWVEVAVHDRYGGPLPALPIVALAENVGEKIARLNRRSLARDAYDLVWLATTPGLELDRSLVRRLAVLKAWVDLHGLRAGNAIWLSPLPGARPFDPDRWLTPREAADFDDEAIGLLTVPPPDLGDLGRDLSRLYAWLAVSTPTSAPSHRASPDTGHWCFASSPSCPAGAWPAPSGSARTSAITWSPNRLAGRVGPETGYRSLVTSQPGRPQTSTSGVG